MGYNPSYKWINPTYPIYNWGYNPLTKWDEPPSSVDLWDQPEGVINGEQHWRTPAYMDFDTSGVFGAVGR